MTNEKIASLARVALGMMKDHRLHSSTYEELNTSFNEARKVAELFSQGVRRIVAESNSMNPGCTVEVAQAFAKITIRPQGFRSWVELAEWCGDVEDMLDGLEQRRYIAQAIQDPKTDPLVHQSDSGLADEWTHFGFGPRETVPRRFRFGASDSESTQVFVNGEWAPSVLTVGEVRVLIGAMPDKLAVPLRVQLSGASEVTDPETGTTYKLDGHGAILSRAPHSATFYAAPCNVHIIEAVIRLGLVVSP